MAERLGASPADAVAAGWLDEEYLGAVEDCVCPADLLTIVYSSGSTAGASQSPGGGARDPGCSKTGPDGRGAR